LRGVWDFCSSGQNSFSLIHHSFSASLSLSSFFDKSKLFCSNFLSSLRSTLFSSNDCFHGGFKQVFPLLSIWNHSHIDCLESVKSPCISSSTTSWITLNFFSSRSFNDLESKYYFFSIFLVFQESQRYIIAKANTSSYCLNS